MTGSKKTTRRDVLSGLGGIAATALATPAIANDPIGLMLRRRDRSQWNNQFDARNSNGSVNASSLPIFSTQTPQLTEQAINEYRQIVANGGWPLVPANKKLQLGVEDKNVAILRKRLMVSGDLDRSAGQSDVFDSWVDAGVKLFQARHGLPADGVMGRFSFAALNVPANTRLGQLDTNMVRLRSMSGFLGDRYVMVNIPAAQIEAVRNQTVESRHTAIVGKIDRQTPIINSKIFELNLNPYWTAPVSIVRKDLIPIMQKDPEYMTRNKIRIYDQASGQEIDPAAIDWNSDEAVKYMFRQDPGKINAMGSVKINFPNPHAVYMHDTPQQSLFGKLLRFESSGCVRVQNVRDLVTWLSNQTPGWDRRTIERTIESGDRTDIKLAQPVPVYFTYLTAWSTRPGLVQFRDDIYKRDGVAELAYQ